MNLASMKCLKITYSGIPSRSYIARKKNGSIMMIMHMAAKLMFPVFRKRKYAGIPIAAAIEKQISCRFVRLKKILDLTLVRSLGTEIYADKLPPP